MVNSADYEFFYELFYLKAVKLIKANKSFKKRGLFWKTVSFLLKIRGIISIIKNDDDMGETLW